MPCPSRRLSFLLLLASVPTMAWANRGPPVPNPPEARLQETAKAYKIEIVAVHPTFPVQTEFGKIEGAALEAKALAEYTDLFIQEFTLYPPELIKKSKLERIVLCSTLSFAGQKRKAIPDFEHNTLYLDAGAGCTPTYLRKVIHHEFFHMIDQVDDGHLYEDDAWSKLNPIGFKYGDGGKNAQGQTDTSVLTDKYPGFLNHYSTTGVEEDKAEMFANMIVANDYIAKRSATDHTLERKAGRIREILSAFCPQVDVKFWAKARRLKRAEDAKKAG